MPDWHGLSSNVVAEEMKRGIQLIGGVGKSDERKAHFPGRGDGERRHVVQRRKLMQ
jgi:hypothetical protein